DYPQKIAPDARIDHRGQRHACSRAAAGGRPANKSLRTQGQGRQSLCRQEGCESVRPGSEEGRKEEGRKSVEACQSLRAQEVSSKPAAGRGRGARRLTAASGFFAFRRDRLNVVSLSRGFASISSGMRTCRRAYRQFGLPRADRLLTYRGRRCYAWLTRV